MTCDWCSLGETAKYVVVFGSMITMEVWDVQLCQRHTDAVRRQTAYTEPIWAPLHWEQPQDQAHYADDWLISEPRRSPRSNPPSP